MGEALWSRTHYSLETGSRYSGAGEYVGYVGGCVGSAAIFAATVAGAVIACAEGAPIGGQVGQVIGGGLGIINGFLTYRGP